MFSGPFGESLKKGLRVFSLQGHPSACYIPKGLQVYDEMSNGLVCQNWVIPKMGGFQSYSQDLEWPRTLSVSWVWLGTRRRTVTSAGAEENFFSPNLGCFLYRPSNTSIGCTSVLFLKMSSSVTPTKLCVKTF